MLIFVSAQKIGTGLSVKAIKRARSANPLTFPLRGLSRVGSDGSGWGSGGCRGGAEIHLGREGDKRMSG